MPRLFEKSLAKSFRDTESFPLNLAFSQLFPGFRSYSQSEKKFDLQGSDVRIQMGDRAIHADLKFRDTDPRLWREDDLAIELLSVVELGIRGYGNQRTDYIIWVFKNSGRVVAVPFAPFKRFYNVNWNYWYFWRAEKPQKTVMKNGYSYNSIHCYVPFDLVADMALEVQVESNRADLLRN